MAIPTHIILTEVSPRDGLQNEPVFVATKDKIKFIELLTAAHFPIIETTAFVNPKKIPALADHDIVMKHFSMTGIGDRGSGISEKTHSIYSALIPNLQGLMNAISCGCNHIAVITTVSETFAQKNMGCSIAESIERIKNILKITKEKKIFIRAYISCTLGCPYEGVIPPEKTAQLAKQLLGLGCDEVAIADTIGTGTPTITRQLMQAVMQFIPVEKIAVHFHDTYGHAIENIKTCLELGISKIDASVGGIGGCPYAKGATGNVATEKVLDLLDTLHIKTNINRDAVNKASTFIKKIIL